jgi:kumamolisin
MNRDSHKVPLPGSTRVAVTDAKLKGKADASRLIKVSIYAKLRDKQSALRAAVARDDVELPGKRKYLSDAQFAATYGADPANLDKIAKWAETQKLKVLERSVPKRLVLVEGLISDFEKAFSVKLNIYSDAQGGAFRGRKGEIHVPAKLANIIDGVFGLDTRRVGRPRLRRAVSRRAPLSTTAASGADKTASSRAFAKARGTFFPPEVAKLYNYPASLDGSGENIAIFAFNGTPDGDPHGGYRLGALKMYFEQVLGGVTPPIVDVRVQPGNEPGPDTKASGDAGDTTGEVMLDMCVVGSVAPGAKIFVYFTEFTSQGWVDALHEAITDNNHISIIKPPPCDRTRSA